MDIVPRPPDQPKIEPLLVPKATTPEEEHFEALFPRWCGLGDSRSYSALAHEAQVGILQLQRHATRFKWRDRMLAVTTVASEQAMVNTTTDLAEVQTRHLLAVRELHAKAVAAIKNIVFEKPADVLKALELAVKLERLVLGLDNEQNESKLSNVLAERLRQLSAEGETKQAEADFVMKPEQEPPDLPDNPNPT